MPDNIPVTPGAGATVATDEVTIDGALAHVQRVKVVHGAPGSAADITSTNQLPVKAYNPMTDLVESGLTYFAGGEIQTTVTTPNASLALDNPAASGRNAYITGWSVYADAAARVSYYLGGTHTGTIRAPVNGIPGGGVASVCTVRIGAGTYTPGTELTPASRVNTQAPIRERGRYLKIVPGTMVVIRFIGPGATNTVDFDVEWFERPV